MYRIIIESMKDSGKGSFFGRCESNSKQQLRICVLIDKLSAVSACVRLVPQSSIKKMKMISTYDGHAINGLRHLHRRHDEVQRGSNANNRPRSCNNWCLFSSFLYLLVGIIHSFVFSIYRLSVSDLDVSILLRIC